MEEIVTIVYGGILFIMSLTAFIAYGVDKKKAIHGDARIKEKTLLLFTTIGGGIGGAIGRVMFKHKTQKFYFSLITYLSLIIQVGTLGLLIVL